MQQEQPEASAAEAEPEEQRPTKRTRASIACDNCKRRKIRCDNISPACSECAASSLACVFSARTAKRGRPSTIVKALQAEQRQQQQPKQHEEHDISTSPAASASGTMPHDLDWLLNASNWATSTSNAPEQQQQQSPTAALPSTVASVQQPETTTSEPIQSSVRPKRARSIEEIGPRPVIAALIDIWFEHWHSFIPILDKATFMLSFHERRDTYDRSYMGLLLALCAATCTCSYRMPMLPELASKFATWEDAARRFNASMPPARTREMFSLCDISVVQNIILVSAYELAIGSSLAFHLISEATRFAVAYGYTSEDRTISAIEQDLRRNIFWVLFQWSVNSAFMSNSPMALRTDESHVSMPPYHPADNLATIAFFASAKLSVVAEGTSGQRVTHSRLIDVAGCLLRFHADKRTVLPARDSFRTSISAVLNCLSDLPVELTRAGLQQASSMNSGKHLAQVWAVRLLVKQQYICLELYHRYLDLLPVELRKEGHSKIARIAGHLISAISPLPRDCVDAIGPPYLDLIYRSRQYLQESATSLDDPFDRQQALGDSAAYCTLLEQVDSLRRINAVTARPRAYNAGKSVQPSRVGSPVPMTSTSTLQPAVSLDPTSSIFDEIWQSNTSYADPSIGSMGLVNMLPYFSVPGYQEALEAYTYSPSEADNEHQGTT